MNAKPIVMWRCSTRCRQEGGPHDDGCSATRFYPLSDEVLADIRDLCEYADYVIQDKALRVLDALPDEWSAR